MYWGHLGHFHRVISHLKWYEIVCMRYLACTFSQMKSINMFSMFLHSGVPRHFLWRSIAVWMYNCTVFMFMYISVDLKLYRQYAETWVFGMFSYCVRQGKYILGWVIAGDSWHKKQTTFIGGMELVSCRWNHDLDLSCYRLGWDQYAIASSIPLMRGVCSWYRHLSQFCSNAVHTK